MVPIGNESISPQEHTQ